VNLSAFYAVVSATCFTLVGLFWGAVDRRRDLLVASETRTIVGGIYLSFLLPALMGLFAEIAPESAVLWRVTFGLAALLGLWSTYRLIQVDRRMGPRGPFQRNRWIVAVLYAVVFVVGAAPELAQTVGLTGLQAAALAIVGLVAVAHGLTWELLTSMDLRPEDSSPDARSDR
jgi:uncharacterized membrane protein